MPSLAITGISICSGQGHFTVGVSVDGGPVTPVTISRNDMENPITREEKELFLSLLLRIYVVGRTRVQVRTSLQNGISVVL